MTPIADNHLELCHDWLVKLDKATPLHKVYNDARTIASMYAMFKEGWKWNDVEGLAFLIEQDKRFDRFINYSAQDETWCDEHEHMEN